MKRIYSWLFLISACILSLLVGYLVSPKEISFPVCSYSVSDNLVPIVNNNYFNTTFNEISNANKSIDLILYEFKWYDSNNVVVKLRQSLADAVKRNVSVRVILDQNQYRDVLTELSKENKKTGDYLKSRGVEVKYDSLTQTTHNKMIIVDDSTVILGSHNWGYSALTRNNEASVMIKDKGVAEYYNNYFEILWKNL